MGFEPTIPGKPECRFSRAVPSTTRPSLHDRLQIKDLRLKIQANRFGLRPLKIDYVRERSVFDLLNSVEIIFFDPKLEDFVAGLERPTLAKTLRALDLLEQFGNELGMPHSKKIGSGLFELRVRGRHEV